MKNKRIIIHIGTIKTGTTSIQNMLGTNRDKLKQYNIRYPDIVPFNHTYTFSIMFLERPHSWGFILREEGRTGKNIETLVEEYRKKWIEEFQKCNEDTFIISAELLCNCTEHGIQQVKEFVLEYFDEAEIIVYVRPIEDLLRSMAVYNIKHGNSCRSLEGHIDSTLKKKNSPLYYTNAIQGWIKVFGKENVIIRAYNKEHFTNNRLICDFLDAIKADPNAANVMDEIKKNVALGKNSLALLEQLNLKYPKIIDGKLNSERGLVYSDLPSEIYEAVPDEKFTLSISFTQEQRDKLNSEIDWINQYLTPDLQFEYISQREGKPISLSAENIPVDYFVELINEYNKKIEYLQAKSVKLRIENDDLKKRIANAKSKTLSTIWKVCLSRFRNKIKR